LASRYARSYPAKPPQAIKSLKSKYLSPSPTPVISVATVQARKIQTKKIDHLPVVENEADRLRKLLKLVDEREHLRPVRRVKRNKVEREKRFLSVVHKRYLLRSLLVYK
jgi:hypothetical protein